MRILILGGTGLISTRITQQLLARGEEVWHFNRGQRTVGFGGISFDGPIHTILGDRAQAAQFESRLRDAPMFDCVIDMIGYTPSDAESDLRAFGGRCGQLIFCSTVDVYAHPHPHGALPYREDAPQAGRNSYALNKIACEAILSAAGRRGELNVTIIRPAYTYAEGALILDSLGMRLAYLDRLRKGKPIIVHGDGQSLWCACHADDVARAFVHAAGSPDAFGKSYHVTGEEFLTWNQYHETVAQAIGAPPPTLIHIPTEVLARMLPSAEMSDPVHWTLTNFQFNNIFDNTAARRDLSFRYTVPWAEGAKRLVDWLAAHGRLSGDDSTPDAIHDDILIAVWNQACKEAVRALGGPPALSSSV
ncbi:MAG: NAD-dependent epimerase/dehydratase family protein [Anaerolineae bacterium]|nr:NAD-dependent epimerase/dehydratase family protein [Thermoflexales bacterium]MDW8408711.1 NAD-dependent epimerase/dehydratase family protein [Anaerolineae bacterium]